MGSMCRCVKKREKYEEETKEEEKNSIIIEEIMKQIERYNLCHTGIWPVKEVNKIIWRKKQTN